MPATWEAEIGFLSEAGWDKVRPYHKNKLGVVYLSVIPGTQDGEVGQAKNAQDPI
jgi:hypothetical protein